MAKTAVTQWDTTAANNSDVGGINTAEGALGKNWNNATREMMAQIATETTALRALIGSTVLETTAALGLYTRVSGQTSIRTLGNTASDDGGGYLWRYDSTDTTSTTDWPAVVVGADGSRWKNAGPFKAFTTADAAKIATVVDAGTIIEVDGNASAGDDAGFFVITKASGGSLGSGRLDPISIGTVFKARNATNAALAAAFSNGTVVTLGDSTYVVDSTATGTASATNDLSVDGLRAPSTIGYIGPETGRTLVVNNDINRLAVGTSSSVALQGDDTQPNAIGKEAHIEWATSDGSTTVYNLTVPFTVSDESWVNIRVLSVRPSDGLISNAWTEGSGFTVSNYGTGAPQITLTSAATSGEEYIFTVYGDEDESASDAKTLQAIMGYDSSTAAIASIVFSHHSFVKPGNGHNSILGGSYIRVLDGSYSVGMGTNVTIGRYATSVGIFAFGRGIHADGNDSLFGGLGGKYRGIGSFGWGAGNNLNNHDYAMITGRGGYSLADGVRIHAGKKSTDASDVLKQSTEVVFSGDTTNATITALSIPTGATNYPLVDNYVGGLRVEGTAILDPGTGTKMQFFAGDFLITRDNSSVARINGSSADVSVTSVSSLGTPGYALAVRGLGGNLAVHATGAASENVQWVVTCRITENAYGA